MLSSTSIATPNPRFAKVREWTKLIAITGSAQIVVQAIGFVSGILVIRLLPVEEYAYYTIANTMLGTMTLLADGGIASGVMSEGGKVWGDKKKMGSVLATGMKLRWQFATYSLAVSIPILYFLLMKQGASWITSTMIVLCLLPAFFSALSGAILEISAKLHQNVLPLQLIQITSNAIRLSISGIFLFFFPFAMLAVLASGLSQIYGNWRLRQITNNYADRSQDEDIEVRARILGMVKRVLPGAFYYSFSGQITIWLIALFGKLEAVAEIGALGRLIQVFAIFTALFSVIVVPRYARLASDPRTVRNRFLQTISLVALGCLFVVAIVSLFPGPFLQVLGHRYVMLEHELQLITMGSSVNLLAGCIFSLNLARGKIVPPSIAIAYSLTVQIAAIATQDLSQTTGVLWISLITGSFQTILHFINALWPEQ